MRIYFSLAVLLGLVFAGVGAAGTYYVDMDGGDDSNSGTSSSPLETISEAVSRCSTNGPNTIYVAYLANDPYTERVLIENKNNLTIDKWGSSKPIIDGADTYPDSALADGTTSLGLIEVKNCHDVTIRNLIVNDSLHVGITVRNTNTTPDTEDIIIEYCEVNNSKANGILVIGRIHTGSWQNPPEMITVRNCFIDSANTAVEDGEALTFAKVHDFWCYDNDVTDNYKEGINIVNGCNNGHVYRNTVYDFHEESGYFTDGTGTGIYVDAWNTDLSDIEIYDNIVYDQGHGITIASEKGADVDSVDIYNNIVYNVKWHNFLINDDAGSNSGDWGNRTNIHVYNNTFVGDVLNEIVKINEDNTDDGEDKIAGFQFKNNILSRSSFKSKDMILQPSNFDEIYYTHNLYYNGGGSITGDLGTFKVTADPEFESKTWSGWPYSSSYFIKSTSQAKENGTTITGVADDIAGTSRPGVTFYDIGAFERP